MDIEETKLNLIFANILVNIELVNPTKSYLNIKPSSSIFCIKGSTSTENDVSSKSAKQKKSADVILKFVQTSKLIFKFG